MLGKIAILVSLVPLTLSLASAQSQPAASDPIALTPALRGVEVLSDTQGMDFSIYLRRVNFPIRRNWHEITRAGSFGTHKLAQLAVEFSIAKEGSVGNAHITQSSNDQAVDEAALNAVRNASPLPALPETYTAPSLSLRMHFFYNPNPTSELQGPIGLHGSLAAGGIDQPHPPMPRVLYQTEPEYSDEARRKHIQGVIILSLTVSDTGAVTDAVVTKGIGYGLDEKALQAVRQWKFSPAMKDGSPVSAVVPVEVSFNLYGKR